MHVISQKLAGCCIKVAIGGLIFLAGMLGAQSSLPPLLELHGDHGPQCTRVRGIAGRLPVGDAVGEIRRHAKAGFVRSKNFSSLKVLWKRARSLVSIIAIENIFVQYFRPPNGGLHGARNAWRDSVFSILTSCRLL